MARIVKFEGSRVGDTWYHTGHFVIDKIEGFDEGRTVFDRSARSVIQDDCHVHSVLYAGIKNHIAVTQYCEEHRIDATAHKISAMERLQWILEFLGNTDMDHARETIGMIWSDDFDRI